MPILNHKLPAEIAETFSRRLPEFVWAAEDKGLRQEYVGEMGPVPRLADLGQRDDPDMVHDAHPIFVLGLGDVAEDAGVEAATHTGWRFFAGNAPGQILLGTVSRKADGWKMTAGYYGERVWATYLAVRALAELAQVRASGYKLRILAVPGLNLEAFWLVAQDAKETDLLVPYPAPPDQPIEALNREPVSTMANFLEAIRPLARQRLMAEATYGG